MAEANPEIADVLAKLRRDLDWRGPSGRAQGVLTLTRTEALLIIDYLERKC